MAGIADLFRLNDGSIYQNTLAQVLQAVNQAEQRKVQREGLQVQNAGNEMDYAAKLGQTQATRDIANQTDARDKAKQAQDLQYNYMSLAERAQNNQAKLGIDQQNADTNRMDADTKRTDVLGNLFFKGKEEARKEGEYNMKSYDWQQAQADRQTLSKALQEGGVDGYAAALGQIGRADDMTKVLNYKEAYKRNMYLNNETYLDSIKKGEDLEVGRRMREGWNIALTYQALSAKDPDLADKKFQQDLANSPYFNNMADDIATAKIVFPAQITADALSLGKLAQDDNGRRAAADLFRGFGQGYQYSEKPTKEMQNAQAILDAKASGNNEYARLLEQGSKQAPLVQIGPDGKEISPSSSAMQTEDQKQLAAGQQVESQLKDLVGLLSDPNKSKYLLAPEGVKTYFSDLAAKNIPEGSLPDWMVNQVKGSTEIKTALGYAAFQEVLRIAATTFTQGIVDKIAAYYPSPDDSPIRAREKAEAISKIIHEANEKRMYRLQQGGTDITPDNKKDTISQLAGLSKEAWDAVVNAVNSNQKTKALNDALILSSRFSPDKVAAKAQERGWGQ